MNRYLLGNYGSIVLPELISKINNDYYKSIEKLISSTVGYLDHLHGTGHEISVYKAVLAKAEPVIVDIIKFRQEIIVPYIDELHEKASTGHNCSLCSGKCDVQHKFKTIELTTGHEQLRLTAISIKTSLPALEYATSQGHLKVLHNEVNLCCNAIHEVLYLEEYILVPKIIEAQKKINVHS